MRVLLVEDERTIAAYVKRGLEEQGYAVDVAYDGREALEWLDAAPFDLVVLDVMRRLRSMIEDLLRLARGEVRGDTEREAVNLSFLLADVVETLQPLAEERALAPILPPT